MRYVFFLLILASVYCGCSRGKYYVTDIFRKQDVAGLDSMVLDSTYQLYLRVVYKYKNDKGENVLISNAASNDLGDKTRIEVEYLLLSGVHKNALYISTIPDKYLHYYSTNYFADTLLNAYDFSTFHFGKISPDGESISFTSQSRQKINTWDLRPFLIGTFPAVLTIREIAIQKKDLVENVILLSKTLDPAIFFKRQNSFSIIFEKPGSRTDTCIDYMFCKLREQNIYFKESKNSNIDLLFRFNKNINGSKDSTILFDSRRTRYAPVR